MQPAKYAKPTVGRFSGDEPLDVRSSRLAQEFRRPLCTLCKLNETAATVCMWGNGPVPCAGMIVGENPTGQDEDHGRHLTSSSTAGGYLDNVLKDHDLDRSDIYVTAAVKCKSPYEGRDKLIAVAQKECAIYLESEIKAVAPNAVLAMGASAYYFFTHGKGIMKHRGQSIWDPIRNLWVVPTIHPNAVLRNPALHAAFESDVSKFKRLMTGNGIQPRVNVIEIRTIEDFRNMVKVLEGLNDRILTFDLETRGLIDFIPGYSKVWCAALTKGIRDETGAVMSYLVPIEHPDSPFLDNPSELKEVALTLSELILRHKTNGHNVKFDIRHIRSLQDRYNEYRNNDEIFQDALKVKNLELWPAPEPVKRKRRKVEEILAEYDEARDELPEVDDAIFDL